MVIVPDAFGWEFNNNRILADSLAEKGKFRILLPDFMGGQYQPCPHVNMNDTKTIISSRLVSVTKPARAFRRPRR